MPRRTALPMAAVAYVGAVVGALIGLHIPKAAFNPVIVARAAAMPSRIPCGRPASWVALSMAAVLVLAIGMYAGRRYALQMDP